MKLVIAIVTATSTFHRGWLLSGADADSSAQQLRAAAAVALTASVTARPVFVAARRPRRQSPGECLEPGPHHDPARAELTARAACVTPRGPLIVQALAPSGAEDDEHDGAAPAAAAWAAPTATAPNAATAARCVCRGSGRWADAGRPPSILHSTAEPPGPPHLWRRPPACPSLDRRCPPPPTQLHPPASTHGSWRVHTPSLPKAPPLSAHHSFQPQAMPRRWPGRWRRPALWRRPARQRSGWELSSRGLYSRAGGGSVEAVAAERAAAGGGACWLRWVRLECGGALGRVRRPCGSNACGGGCACPDSASGRGTGGGDCVGVAALPLAVSGGRGGIGGTRSAALAQHRYRRSAAPRARLPPAPRPVPRPSTTARPLAARDGTWRAR